MHVEDRSLSAGQTLIQTPTRQVWSWTSVIIAVLLAVRTPLILRQSGGQDEDFYAVPGWSILRYGVPQIPYVPSRNSDSVFYKADVALYTLPPAYFYWQALVYTVTGASYAAARFASLLAGVVAVGLVYVLGARCANRNVGLLAAGIYSLSRLFFFPATFARPDMLCAAFALASVTLLMGPRPSKNSTVFVAGALGGLAMLSHPFAIVAVVQAVMLLLFRRESWKQSARFVVLFAAGSMLTFALWLPLIALHPDVFWTQFGNNVLHRSGPGLWSRLLLPLAPLKYHALLLWEHAGPVQTFILSTGLVAATIIRVLDKTEKGDTTPSSSFGQMVLLAWTGVYLTAAFQGEHPAIGYWCYPAAFAYVALAFVLVRVADTAAQRLRVNRGTCLLGLAVVIAACHLPGSGLRAWVAHVAHWNDANFDHPRFVRRLIADLPADAAYQADVSFVLDLHLAGRDTVLAQTAGMYFESQWRDYDYLIVGRTGLEADLPRKLDGELLSTYGDREDPFSCYAEVYVKASRRKESGSSRETSSTK